MNEILVDSCFTLIGALVMLIAILVWRLAAMRDRERSRN